MEQSSQPIALMDSHQAPARPAPSEGAAAMGPRQKGTRVASLVTWGHGCWPWTGAGT